jgi:hypothetical protein
LAEDDQVVEPACCRSAVRISATQNDHYPKITIKPRDDIGAPGRIARGGRRSASASLRPAAALRASTSNLSEDGQVVELGFLSVGSSN